jgi:hypothetical protein
MRATADDPYVEFENAFTDLLTERDRFLERRLRLAAARARVNKNHARYWKAVESAFSVLNLPDVITL